MEGPTCDERGVKEEEGQVEAKAKGEGIAR